MKLTYAYAPTRGLVSDCWLRYIEAFTAMLSSIVLTNIEWLTSLSSTFSENFSSGTDTPFETPTLIGQQPPPQH